MATAKVGDRIRVKYVRTDEWYSVGDVAVIEEVNRGHVMALFDQPENKRVVGGGLWAIDPSCFEIFGREQTPEQRIVALEGKIELLTQVVQLLATTALSGVQQSHAFNGLIDRIKS